METTSLIDRQEPKDKIEKFYAPEEKMLFIQL